MNYPGQYQNQPRPRKPNFFLLLMMGAMAFFLYTQYQKSKQQASIPAAVPEITIPDISNDGPRDNTSLKPVAGHDPHANPSDSPNPYKRNSDWSIDTSEPSRQVEQQQESVNVYRTDSAQEVVRSGDWSIEEGASTPSENGGNASQRTAAPKKTREGDWSIEEVQKK